MPDITYATIPDLTAASDSQVTDNILFETAVPDSQADSGYSSKKVTRGQLLAEVKEDIAQLGGLSDDVKTALLAIAQNVMYLNDDDDYYQNLYDALYPPVELLSITADYTQSGVVYDTATLDSLKSDLVVTAFYDNQTSAVVTNYTLSGTLETGTSTITVSYSGKTATFNVTVTQEALYRLENYTSDRTKTGVDSGVALLDSDRSFTIIFDGVQGSVPSSVGVRLLACSSSASNYKGIYVGAGTSDASMLSQWCNSSNATGLWARNLSNTRVRIVYTREAGSESATIKVKSGTSSVTTKTMTSAFVSNTSNVFICGTSSTSYSWVGTVTKCEIYDRLFTDDEINAFLA